MSLFDQLADSADLSRWWLTEHRPGHVGIFCCNCSRPVATVNGRAARFYPVGPEGPRESYLRERDKSQGAKPWAFDVSRELLELPPCPSRPPGPGLAQIRPLRGPRPRQTPKTVPNRGGKKGNDP